MLLYSNWFLSNLASGTCECALSKSRLLAMLGLKGKHRNDALVKKIKPLQLIHPQ